MSASSALFPGRESKIILLPLQVAFFILVTAAMVSSFIAMHRRNRRSWHGIVARMSPECRLAWRKGPDGLKDVIAIWAKTPSAAFRDAGVLMEMAEYAERNALQSDSASIRFFRNAALELRLAAAGAVIRHACFR
ncbi:MAG TPA: hypothetical protein VN753_05220 [Terracidiphilus sp.]|nr:hypothetical protein [Terracidiphilus sp.]